MIPGLPQDLLQGSDEEGSLRLKRMIYMTDSMTASELDSDGSPFMEVGKDGKPIGLTWRVARVAKGSGTSVREVEELLCQYRMMANMAKQAGGKHGWCARLLYCTSQSPDFPITLGYKPCRKCKVQLEERVVEQTVCRRKHRYKPCRFVFLSYLARTTTYMPSSEQCLLVCSSKCNARCAVGVVCKK